MEKELCYWIGLLTKTHGKEGSIILKNTTDLPEELESMESVFIEIDKQLVPFFITHVRFLSSSSAEITFEDIDTKEKAKELCERPVYVEKDQIENEDYDFIFHSLVGYTVEDEKYGKLGTVNNFYDNPDNPLLEIHYGNQEIYIPANTEFVKSINHSHSTIYLSLPHNFMETFI